MRRSGYKIVGTNWRCPAGEIDIIAMHQQMLVFVEVKARGQRSPSLPEDGITRDKKRHVRNAAQAFINRHQLGHLPYRFDVVAVTARTWPLPCVIDHYEGAFS